MEATSRSERGNVMLFVIMCLPLLIGSMALGVDVARGNSVKVIQKQELDDAQQAVLVRQEQIKYSPDPARLTCELVRASLEQDGFVGVAQLSYLERYHKRPPGSAQDDERHVVVELALAQGLGSSLGMWTGVPVSDSAVWTMLPYASYRVFLPPQLADADGATFGRRYVLECSRNGGGAHATVTGQEALDLNDLSVGAREALEGIALR